MLSAGTGVGSSVVCRVRMCGRTCRFADRVSWRMMSMVTSWDQRGLRVMRASRAAQAARISPEWASKSSAQTPARHISQARSPTSVGRIRITRGMRPERVCMRVSQQTRWRRCRVCRHHARRVSERRVPGTPARVVIPAAVMSRAAVTGEGGGKPPGEAAERGEGVASVRQRHRCAGGAVHAGGQVVEDVGVVAGVALPGGGRGHGGSPPLGAGGRGGGCGPVGDAGQGPGAAAGAADERGLGEAVAGVDVGLADVGGSRSRGRRAGGRPPGRCCACLGLRARRG